MTRAPAGVLDKGYVPGTWVTETPENMGYKRSHVMERKQRDE